MCVTPVAGRLVDRRGADAVNLACFLLVVAATAVLTLGALGGTPGLLSPGAGTLLPDVGTQCGMVADQVRVQTLPAPLPNRLTTACVTCVYLGGSLGSRLGTRT